MNPTAKPWTELLFTLILPALILMQLSDPARLGALPALLLALALPLAWGVMDLLRRGNVNLFAALGLVSVLLTGGISLLRLDNQWLAVKEAAIPGLLGWAVIVSMYTRYPLVKTLLFNPAVVDLERVRRQLEAKGATQAFEARLRHANWQLGGTFFFSSVMNYVLASWIVVSPSGSQAFNEELGQLTLLSYPMIAFPAMLMTIGVFYGLARALRELAGLGLGEVLNPSGPRVRS